MRVIESGYAATTWKNKISISDQEGRIIYEKEITNPESVKNEKSLKQLLKEAIEQYGTDNWEEALSIV